ncbi:hypothetical protein [Paraburkholderia caffeinilytica]|uniref:hypothetical protein n=1 Tax=Paraburkholderia caffeinilytica TaxID=1761016 RepID=UPI000E2194B7|nr:hypothetical protein [Paraburkholderia caffeinilytica]
MPRKTRLEIQLQNVTMKSNAFRRAIGIIPGVVRAAHIGPRRPVMPLQQSQHQGGNRAEPAVVSMHEHP